MLGTPRAGIKLFTSKKHQDNRDKKYLNLCDSFLDLRLVSKSLTCRKQPNNLANSSSKLQNTEFNLLNVLGSKKFTWLMHFNIQGVLASKI